MKLGDICTLITDGKHGDCRDKTGSGFYFLSAKDVKDGKLNYIGAREIEEIDFLETHRRTNLQPGDLLLTNSGTIGRVAIAPDDTVVNRTTFQKSVAVLKPNRNIVIPRFLFYSLLFQQPQLQEIAGGTTQQNLLLKDLRSFEMNIPPLPEQRAIAHILGALDDKIELNRRQNATLEELARAIFKSWFVDFAPVRAKAGGRAPAGMDAATAALFPDGFELIDGREVPRGWSIETLAAFSTLNPESWTVGTYPNTIQYVDLSNTKWGRIEETTLYDRDQAPSRARRVLRSGDTIIGTVRPGNGSYAFVYEDDLTGSTGFAVLRPINLENAGFVYFAATALENIARLAHLADGGAYPAVRPELVLDTQVVQPGENVLLAFSKIIDPLSAKMAQNETQSRTLAALRDALLPKLLTGELRVRDEGLGVGG